MVPMVAIRLLNACAIPRTSVSLTLPHASPNERETPSSPVGKVSASEVVLFIPPSTRTTLGRNERGICGRYRGARSWILLITLRHLPSHANMTAISRRAATILGFASLALASSLAPLRAQAPADKLIDGALKDSAAWNRLAELVDTFGNRPAGSASLESALDWIVVQMKKDGLENVHTEPVMVPHWVRGRESVTLLAPHRATLRMLGLGRSVGTPAGGITAPVLVVDDFADLHAHAAQAKGRIVLFDHHF